MSQPKDRHSTASKSLGNEFFYSFYLYLSLCQTLGAQWNYTIFAYKKINLFCRPETFQKKKGNSNTRA